ncbi:Chitobiosyldiphosphodolichol beta-mannosyltransferase, partial [Fragariocoptes setiger]
MKTATVVVLGQLARSPRMQYHCLSLASNQYKVTVIGYGGLKSCASLEGNPNIEQNLMPEPFDFKHYMPTLFAYFTKTIWQALILMYSLLTSARPDIVLVQVLMDRPPDIYQPLSQREKRNFLSQIMPELKKFWVTDLPKTEYHFDWDPSDSNHTRPAIIISSTSWTEDEDFGLLLDALKLFDDQTSPDNLTKTITVDVSPGKTVNINPKLLPQIVCVITGEGPLKQYYKERIRQINFSNRVHITLPWLSSEDYARMVGASDFGVSLHKSSSGHDLPMKVVDMFGCQVPVISYRYNCIHELVRERENGFLFENYRELNHRMLLLLNDLCKELNSAGDDHLSNSILEEFRISILNNFLTERWDDTWNRKARPYLEDL